MSILTNQISSRAPDPSSPHPHLQITQATLFTCQQGFPAACPQSQPQGAMLRTEPSTSLAISLPPWQKGCIHQVHFMIEAWLFFFIPRRNFSRRIKVFALKNCSSRDCAYFGQLPRQCVKLSSSLLTFECAILGPMTRDFNASSASAPSHPLPLLYVYMLHNYRVVGIYHLFWAVSRKTHNTITSSYCLSQDNQVTQWKEPRKPKAVQVK